MVEELIHGQHDQSQPYDLTNLMQVSLANFFKEHFVQDVLPDNAKLVVMNHEATIQQLINAMVIDQNVQWTAVWDSDKKDFLGIITIRDLLELLVYFVDSLKESFLRDEVQQMTEQPFIGYFLEHYLMSSLSADVAARGRRNRQHDTDHSLDQFKPDLSVLDKILDQVSIYEWFTVANKFVYHKSRLTSDCKITDTLHTTLQHMNEHGLNLLVLINQERSQLQGCINYSEIMRYLVENYTGSDLSIFEEPLSSFDLTHHNLFPSYQKLVIARDTDSLFSVFKKMRDNRVSCIPIEKSISPSDPHVTRSVGLAFMTDIMFLLKLPNFYKMLDQPVINFVKDLNGLEEDLEMMESTQENSCTRASTSQPPNKIDSSSSMQRQRSNTFDAAELKKSNVMGLDAIIAEQYIEMEDHKEPEDQEEGDIKPVFTNLGIEEDESQEGSDNDEDEEQDEIEDTGDDKVFNLDEVKPQENQMIKFDSGTALQIEDLFGKIFGIERVMLMKKTDTLKDVIEKIILVPEGKLLYVDLEQGYPKVRNMLALSDLFAYIATNKQ